MPNWKLAKIYCRSCRQWYDVTCPYCYHYGSVSLDAETFYMFCGVSQHNWLATSGIYHCSYGHQQQIEFASTFVNVEPGDQILYHDKSIIYVLKQIGVLIIGYYNQPPTTHPPIDSSFASESFEPQQKTPQTETSQNVNNSPAKKLTKSDYLKIFGLDENYTVEQVKNKHRDLAKKYHADFHPDEDFQKLFDEKMKLYNEAREYLTNLLEKK